jgi:hypothetical protein
MHVLNEDEYKLYKQYKAQNPTPIAPPELTATCPICGRKFPNENILAHHMKSHVDGYKCNICGKVFKHKRSLKKHLKAHPLQVKESNISVLRDAPVQETPIALQGGASRRNVMQDGATHHSMVQDGATEHNVAQDGTKRRKKHKRQCLNFKCDKWLTL